MITLAARSKAHMTRTVVMHAVTSSSSSSLLSSSRMKHRAQSSSRYQDRCPVPRTKEFYEHGNSMRQYFYVLDLKGQVFLESSPCRNMATCIRDSKFLNFLIKNIQANNTGLYPDIPYISLCGREVNFITTIDPIAVLVFKDLLPVPSSNGDPDSSKVTVNSTLTPGRGVIASQLRLNGGCDHHFIYASSLSQAFDPSLLAYSSSTGQMTPHISIPGMVGRTYLTYCLRTSGRIYHQLTTHKICTSSMGGYNINRSSDEGGRCYGLLHSDIVSQYLTDCILDDDSGTLPAALIDVDDADDTEGCNALPVRFRWTGSRCEEMIYNMELLG